MTSAAFSGVIRWPLRALPAVAATLAVVLVVHEPDSTRVLLAACVGTVAAALELGGWQRAVRRTAGSLAMAVVAGAIVIGGMLALASWSFPSAAPRVAQRTSALD